MNALSHWATDSSSSEEQEEEDDDDEDEFECDKCDRIFSSWNACRQHMNALDHWGTDECSTCSRRFVDRHASEQHMDALGHRSSHYCSSCERHFKNPSDLFQHMNSPTHLRANSIHTAPASPIRSTPTPQSAPTAASAPVASVSGTLATNPSPLLSTPSQPGSRPLAPPPAASSKSAWLSVLGQTAISAPTTLYTLLSSSNLPSILPNNTGTISAPFHVCIEKDTAASINSHYQSITFMQPYLAFSFEELRLADYRAGRKPANPGLQTTAFGRYISLFSTPSAVPTTASATVNVRPDYQDTYTQTETSRPDSSLYFSATSSRAITPDITAVTTPVKHSIDHPSFSLSAIKMLHTEPVVKPKVIKCLTCQNRNAESIGESQIINCPFCRLGFFAVSEVIQHLEATSCPARPDLNRRNIYRFWLQDLAAIQGQGYEIVDMQVQEPLYHCFSTTGKCNDKSLSSLAALHGHLESEDCDYTDREQLRDAVGNFENLIPPFGSC